MKQLTAEQKVKLLKSSPLASRQNLRMLIARDTVRDDTIIKCSISPETGEHRDYPICSVCRTVLNSGDNFCRHCGQKIRNVLEEYNYDR